MHLLYNLPQLTCHELTFREISYIGFGRAGRLLDGELHNVESSRLVRGPEAAGQGNLGSVP